MPKKNILDYFPNQIEVRSRRDAFPGVRTPCWVWIGKNDGSHYGWVVFEGKRYRPYQLSFYFHRGSIPEGMCVCHKCDIRECCNPEHLFLGTDYQNQLDRWKWRFVVDNEFVLGDYDSWRESVLFKESWVNSIESLDDLDDAVLVEKKITEWWERNKHRLHAKVVLDGSTVIELFEQGGSLNRKVELLKRMYYFLSEDEISAAFISWSGGPSFKGMSVVEISGDILDPRGLTVKG